MICIREWECIRCNEMVLMYYNGGNGTGQGSGMLADRMRPKHDWNSRYQARLPTTLFLALLGRSFRANINKKFTPHRRGRELQFSGVRHTDAARSITFARRVFSKIAYDYICKNTSNRVNFGKGLQCSRGHTRKGQCCVLRH